MTSDKFRFWGFIGTLIALVLMFGLACLLAYLGRSVEAIGIGGALTGLIGLAGVLAAGNKQNGEELQGALHQAIQQLQMSVPTYVLPDPTAAPPAAAAVREGAREGTREGVEDALERTDGEPEVLR